VREVWAVRRFVYAKLMAIPSRSTLAPAGIYEDEVPENADHLSTAIVYQVENERALRGFGSTFVWGDFQVLVDVIVPGESRFDGEAASNAVYDALHGITGTVTNGVIFSCVYDGTVPMPPEAVNGQHYDHLMQRFLLHARGT
jgi:hypothetical protein